jgi:hypothetical protein
VASQLGAMGAEHSVRSAFFTSPKRKAPKAAASTFFLSSASFLSPVFSSVERTFLLPSSFFLTLVVHLLKTWSHNSSDLECQASNRALTKLVRHWLLESFFPERTGANRMTLGKTRNCLQANKVFSLTAASRRPPHNLANKLNADLGTFLTMGEFTLQVSSKT